MKVKLYSYYDHFPNHKSEVADAPYVEMYNDEFVWQSKQGSCLLLIEPRSILPNVYSYVEVNWRKFKYIFTHDSRILNHCKNAKFIYWGFGNGNYTSFSDEQINKTKRISICSSWKEMCELHKVRKKIALKYENSGIIDCYGTFNGGSFVEPEVYLRDYMFSIAIENYVDDYWITEKILNCFANKTIPIYLGSREIGKFFNNDGIIPVNNETDIIDWIENKPGQMLRDAYDLRKNAIEDNYKRVQKCKDFETWFFDKYGDLLNEY